MTAESRRRVASLFGFMFAGGLAHASFAGEADAIHYVIGQGVSYENNLFRLPHGVQPDAAETGVDHPARSDIILSSLAGVQFDKTYSRQRIRADLLATHYAYRTYERLDFNAISGRAAWNWVVGNQWLGLASVEHTDTPVSFASHTGFAQVVNHYERASVEANYTWHPDWSAGAGLAEVRNRQSGSLDPFTDYDAAVGDLRVKYGPESGNRIEAHFRSTDGRYPTRQAEFLSTLGSSFRQNDLDVETDWSFAGHSRLTGRVGLTSRQYTGAPLGSRDFRGITGRLIYNMALTGKLAVDLGVRREIGPLDDPEANYVLTTAVSVAPIWSISDKLNVRASAEIRKRDFQSNPAIASGRVASGVDDTQYYNVTGNWMPKRNLVFNLTLAHEIRTGNHLTFPDYRAQVASASVQFRF